MSSEASNRTVAPTALTIAGFDPGSGAGITADLLVFARLGLFATSATAALTVQSTRGVQRVEPVDPALLRDMLAELESDLPADGIKVGMLSAAAQARVVAEFLSRVRARRSVHVVLDPVLVSSSGAPLLDNHGFEIVLADLLPLVDAVTPNLSEVSRLTGLPCRSAADAEQCAAALAAQYPQLTPIVTGGHLESPADLIWWEGKPHWLPGEHIASPATHGTGCVFSSALLASRLLGDDWLQAASAAKGFVTSAIRNADVRGSGNGPTQLLTLKRNPTNGGR